MLVPLILQKWAPNMVVAHSRSFVRSYPTGERPEETLRVINYLVIGKKTLGFNLTDVEVAYLAATGFTGNMNSGGFESYVESPEADLWPQLRHLLSVRRIATCHNLTKRWA